MKRPLHILGYSLTACVIALAVWAGHDHLKSNNYWIYATGTNERAIIKATWRMSPREIERANNIVLSYLSAEEMNFSRLFGPDLMDKTRLTERIQSDISLYGYPARIRYSFFDNKLYAYSATLSTTEEDKPAKEIIETFNSRYGAAKKTSNGSDRGFIFHLEWQNERQEVMCWLNAKDPKTDTYNLGFSASFAPFVREIEGVATSEKKNYF